MLSLLMKKIVGRYVITTDTKDLSRLFEFLSKHNVFAYNYKVSYLQGKLSVRIKAGFNVILSLQGLSLEEAEKLISSTNKESRYLVEFHNTRLNEEIIDILNSLDFPETSEFHVLKDNKILCMIDGFRFKVTDVKILKNLSKDLKKIEEYFKPFNAGVIFSENVLCEVALKYHGIRNVNAVIRKARLCEVFKDYVKIDDFVIKRGKIYLGDKEIQKNDFYAHYA